MDRRSAIAAGLLAVVWAAAACNDMEQSPVSPSDDGRAGQVALSDGCTYSDDLATRTRTVTSACGNARVSVPKGWSLRVERSPESMSRPRAQLDAVRLSSMSSAAAVLTFSTPNADYVSKTIKMDIGSLAELSTTMSVANSQQTMSFSVPLERLQVPNSWQTWSSPPESESATPPILFTQDQNSLTVRLAKAASVVGFEVEPNSFGPFDLTANFFSGTQLVGSVTRNIDGESGARLIAIQSDGLPIDNVSVHSVEGPSGFSIAQLRYSPWAGRAPLPSARRGMAVWATGGFLYAIGGSNSSGTVLKTVQAYSPASNVWTSRAPLPDARQTGNGAVAVGGLIYLAGGHNASGQPTKTLYAYNPSTNTWSTKAPMPVVSSCGGSAVIGAKIYVFSGCTLSGTTQVAAALLHRYDPLTNSWATLKTGPAAHFQPVVGAVSGKLYVAGGNNASGAAGGRLDVYDPGTNTWTTKTKMPTMRVGAAGVSINGKLRVIGGRNGTTYYGTVEAYDPVSDSWSTQAAMPTARAALGVAGVSGFLYAVGGRNANGLLASNERFTP